jgi:pyruvate,water dikinase
MPLPALVEHVRHASRFVEQAIFWHHRFNPCNMVPLGDLLTHATEWTGLPPIEILKALQGFSPLSAGAIDELAALRRALAMDAEAMMLLMSDLPAADIIEQLQSRPAPVGPAARAYLDEIGIRVLGSYDPAERHVRDQPDLLIRIIRAVAIHHDEISREAAAEAAVTAIRDRVPAAHRSEFDELLAEARLTYRVRDERNFHGDALASGIARRAILAAGRRLCATGQAQHPEHLVEASPDELVSLLEGRGGPSTQELAERTRFRLEASMDAAPAQIGMKPSSPPPAEWLPAAAARMQRAITLSLDLMFAAREAHEAKHLKGFAASGGTYEGIARIVSGPSEFPLMQSGEVLVTTATSPTFNVILPLVGAIVTERGGALSHAAIVAREYGVPAVVGCMGATKTVTTGSRVRVDGDKGEVWILD